jgi:7,8-dihydropterin-6-yl-methyl-4-(beta-D-ribofuranosyl)aminobenzene 5'-phosphate synthase
MDSACTASHFSATKVEAKPGDLLPDTFAGEHATVYHVKDRGLVVITSCGHAGVINSVRHAQKVSGNPEGSRDRRRLPPGARARRHRGQDRGRFKEINPDYIIPMHCSG